MIFYEIIKNYWWYQEYIKEKIFGHHFNFKTWI